ncbi:site-2 protease family protein (plasmid) [Octadecabacter sp. SW4]|nr:site-2 protease family protein [Octadecabacter sp. SW4]QEE37547.1 site-2 protease family protein [Octadecabacter sp. SW4]
MDNMMMGWRGGKAVGTGVASVAALFVVCIWLGLFSEWAILGAAAQAISLEGLATFALLSPFLKLPHELGHALVARRCHVPLRRAGIIFVGLFPLPFVDTSAADICANRAQRIRISLAGIFVDLLIAMLAFVVVSVGGDIL